MQKIALFLFSLLSLSLLINPALMAQDGEWVSLFNGKNLDGWKVGENSSTFKVEDGTIVVNGPRAHLFYVGDVHDHEFKNFQFKADVKTTSGSNSGMYFHTEYQEDGWPSKGYEVQVNNSHTDWRRTASLYGIDDVRDAPAKDDEWFTQEITVKDSVITIKVNGKTVTEYVEPKDAKETAGDGQRYLDKGTFALQGHDPKSKVYFKNIMVKALPD
uniref:DUF1080 domain-containing protein n=1 Tax=Roseihalotalea indica TaxID=2867963 RepID=A0AA49GMK4_9BACT|nr:DUF1080 domain-containing protein [Tunicatimonas sp. TK19036]